ncbi:HIT family protein [Methanococcus voltae]|uniref:Histidine triad (HIT) family protein n=2 Tax=Methanococcus voltae TaxID=2188 RepID=A0A8J7RG00_METVO|nr:HIT family protein [Methanococcus voltae]MBP2172916.1 histidine triad (HIT) family protein [Methanococcus voltae]MBP2201674.1 histidine triad (HIT) family protein [Methanococcus voltae]MCS3922462.1 histidine triad (HIT) family protein [Methanococcus voltae PS]
MCIFCDIVNNKIPSRKLYEDDDFLVIMDAFPKSRGHTLILTKEHYVDFDDMSEELASKLIVLVHKMVKKLKVLGMDGYNIINNNQPISGQEVPHVHFHIVPRYNDEKKPVISISEPIEMDLDEIHELLTKN